jgi:leucyl aminopeptidase
MTAIKSASAIAGFKTIIPSIKHSAEVTIGVSKSMPADASCVGLPVGVDGAVPRQLGLDRATMVASGFEAKVGQTMVLPRSDAPTLVAVGIGDPDELDEAKLRDAAAAFARAVGKHDRLSTTLADVANVPPEAAGQAVVEGMLLARYRFDALKQKPPNPVLADLNLVVGSKRADAVTKGAERGQIIATAAQLARDLINTPPAYLTASQLAEVAAAIAAARGLGIEIFDEEALAKLGCGGILGVNAGSVEPPRMIKLTYRPKNASGKHARAAGHIAIVGKGIMYDAGGINLKAADPMHGLMKMDMSGAAAVLSAMSPLAELGCPTAVTGYLMCTDNMPSGSAMKMGDVLTIHGGKTVEVLNTDAEGRLILADGIVMAVEEKPDAIVTIATLTGACLRALGDQMAGLFSNSQAFADQVMAASRNTDELVWQLPLEKRYRKQLDSNIADMKNMGDDNPGAITAALFLEEFVGKVPWAHLDICGTMYAGSDESWRSKGATGFGTRLLIDLAMNFTPTASRI